MGNAYINKVDDAWATFYNPAGLGTVRGFNLHLFNIHSEANKGFFDVVGSDEVAEIPQNIISILDANEARTMMADKPGKPIHTTLSFFPNMTMRYFSAGFFYNQRNRLYMETAASDFEIAERRDYGPTVAGNFSLFGGIIKIGVSAIWLIRREYINTFASNAPINVQDSDYKTGNMLYYTGGLRITLPMWGLPSLSAVVRNAMEYEFDLSGDGTVEPDAIPRTVDVGLSFTPQVGRSTRFHVEVNYKDVADKYGTERNRRIQGGLEIDFSRVFFIRGGFGDGYGSFGLGLRTPKAIVDLTTYAVDTTSGSYRGNEDRRFALSLSSGY